MNVLHNDSTWADHSFNLVDELLGHQVSETLHALHPAGLVAGDALQILVLLNLVEHVSDTDGIHINTVITAHTNTSNEIFSSTQMLVLNLKIQPRSQAPADGSEQRVVISGVVASVSNHNYVDSGFGSATVPDQVVVGVLQSGWSPCSSCDPLQALHCILNSGVRM